VDILQLCNGAQWTFRKVLKNLYFVIWDTSRVSVRNWLLSVSLPCIHRISISLLLFKRWPVVVLDVCYGVASNLKAVQRQSWRSGSAKNILLSLRNNTNKQKTKTKPTKHPDSQSKYPPPPCPSGKKIVFLLKFFRVIHT